MRIMYTYIYVCVCACDCVCVYTIITYNNNDIYYACIIIAQRFPLPPFFPKSS